MKKVWPPALLGPLAFLILLSGCPKLFLGEPPPRANSLSEALPADRSGSAFLIPRYRRRVSLKRRGPAPFDRGVHLALNDPAMVILNKKQWTGPKDLSGDAWLLYGRRNLYFAARVNDQKIGYAGHPGEWGGDAVNLFLKTETEEGVREFIFKFSAKGTRYCYYDRLSYNGEEYDWGAANAQRLPGGYLIKAVIPFRNLGLLEPARSKIWFNISLEDDDSESYMIYRGQTEGFLNAPEWIPARFDVR